MEISLLTIAMFALASHLQRSLWLFIQEMDLGSGALPNIFLCETQTEKRTVIETQRDIKSKKQKAEWLR